VVKKAASPGAIRIPVLGVRCSSGADSRLRAGYGFQIFESYDATVSSADSCVSPNNLNSFQ
jgi:hypothetical protein